MGCLDDNQLLQLLDGSLDPEALAAAQDHLDRCDDCRGLVVGLVARASELSLPPRVPAPPSPPPERSETRPGRPAALAQPARRIVGTRIGRFVVLDKLGQGGMGVVLSARDPRLDRIVALKLIDPIATLGSENSAAARERLLREAKALARLSHPNVLTVYDVGVYEDQVFVAMELAAGGTLRQWLAAERREWPAIVEQFVFAGRGLAAAHDAGLVHRDFKPDNVLMMTDGRVRVADFGLVGRESEPTAGGARGSRDDRPPIDYADTVPFSPLFDDEIVTQAGALLGTPLYMAPEQHTSAQVGPAADQFSFCVALYEALYRQHPFEATTTTELIQQLREGRVAPAPAGSAIPWGLRAVVVRGLQADPAARWPAMTALLEALSAQLARATPARPPPDPAIHARVAELQREIDQAQALADAGRYDEGLPIARAVVEASAAFDYPPLRAEALFCLGSLQEDAGELAAAERTLADAAVEAARAKNDRLAARIWSTMLVVVGYRKARSAEAMMMRPAAEAALARLGEDLETQGRMLSDLGLVIFEQGKYGEALQYFERASALIDQALGPASLLAGTATNNAGYALGRLGRHDEALRLHDRAAAIWRAELAPDHPNVAVTLNNIGEVLHETGDFAGALGHHLRALAIRDHALRPDHPFVALSHDNAGAAYGELGQLEHARSHHERALAIRRSALGDAHPDVADSWHGLGKVLDALGDHDQALQHHERGLAVKQRALGAGHVRIAASERLLADALLAGGAAAAACPHYERAIEILEDTFGAAHPHLTLARDGLRRAMQDPSRPR